VEGAVQQAVSVDSHQGGFRHGLHRGRGRQLRILGTLGSAAARARRTRRDAETQRPPPGGGGRVAWWVQ
jgi:sugar/nucleoside kinase (ribokinase family)